MATDDRIIRRKYVAEFKRRWLSRGADPLGYADEVGMTDREIGAALRELGYSRHVHRGLPGGTL